LFRFVKPLFKGGNEAMTTINEGAEQPARKTRADAQRNEQALLAAAAAVFVTSGVEAPVRDIATAAGVRMVTIYRHFPTPADLVVAVYRHQVELLIAGLLHSRSI
jgi:AcrR family transcriptional regulator